MDVQGEEENQSSCLFRNILHTCRRRSDSGFKEVNVESLKEASRKRKDNFYNGLSNDTSTLTAHEKCDLDYKFSDHIRRHLTRSAASANEGQWSGETIKRTWWSHSAIPFNFKLDCIFCGIACDVKTDDRRPNRRSKKKGMLSRTADRGKEKNSVKEVLLKDFLVKNTFLRQFWFETILRCRLQLKIFNYHAPNKSVLEKLSL